MDKLAAFVRAVERLNGITGRWISWLALATVLVCATVVVLRYAFGIGFIWMQELYVWSHATVFMVGAGYTLLRDQHVRVDVYYARMSPRGKAWVELFGGAIFLLPWLIVLFVLSIPYVSASWRLFEASSQTGGMPGLFLLKSVIIVFCVLLGLQGLAGMARAVLTLAGREVA